MSASDNQIDVPTETTAPRKNFHRAYFSSVFDQSAEEVWSLVRDFNNYPRYIEGVTESVIEDGKSGDEVGAVRRFRLGDIWLRQRLEAHSDTTRSLTYAGLEKFHFPDLESAHTPGPVGYRGTIRLTPIVDGDRTFVEWFVDFEGQSTEIAQWTDLLLKLIAQWVESLSRTLAGQR
jgi:hypothetical protein